MYTTVDCQQTTIRAVFWNMSVIILDKYFGRANELLMYLNIIKAKIETENPKCLLSENN